MDSSDYDFLFKVVLCGDSGVGKTNLHLRFQGKEFKPDFKSTVGVDFATKTLKVDGKTLKTQIWDSSGQERFRSVSHAYYRGAVGALLVYDISKKNSFESLKTWLKDIKNYAEPNITCIIIGNKCDLSDIREVSTEEGKEFAVECGFSFVETSALDNTNVDKAFEQILTQIYRVAASKALEKASANLQSPEISRGENVILSPISNENDTGSSCAFRNSLQDVSGDSIYQSCNGLDETHLTSQCYVHHHNLVEDLNLAIQLDKELNFHNLVEEGRFNDENLDVDENLAILLTFQFLEEDSQNRFFTNNNILTTETISRLERTKKECCICMEELKFDDMENEVRALRCIHVFHSSCIDNWITSGDNHNCPICRLTINE
ncbi:hypothetical protein HK099_001068 [Clydaea vesicula]|uniref:RING-type domain-containing protein n=1 Tax=Clydaea vesicula TaxID=447962 RepID=A0AAD5U408_9FUNG|nr:hypothetical protein HK099_001068 [Clydaea vesicula]KAJ3392548.1 hypothetical protein HDU92_008307 [Lobulomyces angularis]